MTINNTNPFNPNKGRISRVLTEAELTINLIAERQDVDFSLPVVCIVDGQAVLRKNWNIPLNPDASVSFVSLPLGGGGGSSNPLQVVMMVAVVVASVYTGGAVGAAYGAVWGGVAAAGVSIGGGILINTLVPTPKPALNGMTYSLQAQGNSARLGNPIPVIYGKHLIYPDFAAQPYYKYKNDLIGYLFKRANRRVFNADLFNIIFALSDAMELIHILFIIFIFVVRLSGKIRVD